MYHFGHLLCCWHLLGELMLKKEWNTILLEVLSKENLLFIYILKHVSAKHNQRRYSVLDLNLLRSLGDCPVSLSWHILGLVGVDSAVAPPLEIMLRCILTLRSLFWTDRS